MTQSLNDVGWPAGRARLGYGLDGEATTLLSGNNPANKPITCYFRHAFTVADPALFGPLQINAQVDDGAAIYLNGVELFRSNLPNEPLTPTTLALAAVGGAGETNWFQTNLITGPLMAGTNLLAVEVHQASTNSSDLGFDLELTAILQPELTILATSTNHLLRWPAGAPGFRVQTVGTLEEQAAWATLTATGRVNGAYYELPLPLPPPRFFRLNAP